MIKGKKVLFICNANVARSQIAEIVFNSLCKERGLKHKAESAGLSPGKYKGVPVRESSLNTKDGLEEAGFSLKDEKSKKITKTAVKKADKVILMTNKGEIPDYVSELSEGKEGKLVLWNIEDPKHRDLNFYRKVIDEIHIKVNRLIDELEKENGSV